MCLYHKDFIQTVLQTHTTTRAYISQNGEQVII